MFVKVVLCLLFFIQVPITSTQFQNHIDLQKLGETFFKNARYNVFRPAVHVISDHFKDYMLRKQTDFPSKRLFLDKNGFRHYWSGFESNRDISRKANDKTVYEGNKFEESANTIKNKDSESNRQNKLKYKPKRKKLISDEVILRDTLREGDTEGKTLVKTTFFCPFLGVITMTSHID